MQGSARAIRLDQCVPLPEGCLYVLPSNSGDPYSQSEFGSGKNLRLDATNCPNCISQTVLCYWLEEVMAGQAPLACRLPGK